MPKRFSSRIDFYITENDVFMLRRLRDLSPGASASEIIRQGISEKYKRAFKAEPVNVQIPIVQCVGCTGVYEKNETEEIVSIKKSGFCLGCVHAKQKTETPVEAQTTITNELITQ